MIPPYVFFRAGLVFFLAGFVFCGLTPQPVTARGGGHYYVSPQGNDANDGSEGQPWLTIQKAADTANPGDTVHILKGIYRESVILQRSGRAGSPIRFVAEDGGAQVGDEAVRLWGSEDSRGLVWNDLNQVACPADAFSGIPLEKRSEVFCADLSAWTDGSEFIVPDIVAEVDSGGGISALVRAREPDVKIPTTWKHHEYWWTAVGGSLSGGKSNNSLYDNQNDTLPAGVEAGSISDLGDLRQASLFVIDSVDTFYYYRREIESMLPAGCTPGLNCSGVKLRTQRQTYESRSLDFDFNAANPAIGPFSKYFVEGAPSLLDTKGEWVYDAPSHKLYIWSETSPASKQIEIAKRHLGISFSDPQEINPPVSYVTLDGLSIQLMNLYYRYLPSVQENVVHNPFNYDFLGAEYSAGALSFNTWEDLGAPTYIKMTNLLISHCADGIVLMQEGSQDTKAADIELSHSVIHDIDGVAVQVWGFSISDTAADFPAVKNLTFSHNTVQKVGFRPNNVWGDNSMGLSFSVSGIQGLLIEDNLIEHIAHLGIAIQEVAPPNVSNDILVKGNTIRYACENGGDCAGLYFWVNSDKWRIYRNVTVAENIFENNTGWAYMLAACHEPYNRSGSPPCEQNWGNPETGVYGHGYYLDHAAGVSAYRNLIRNNGACGVYIPNPASRRGRFELYNNVVEENAYGMCLGYFYGESATANGMFVKNNVFYENRFAGLQLTYLEGRIYFNRNFYKTDPALSNSLVWLVNPGEGDLEQRFKTTTEVTAATGQEQDGLDFVAGGDAIFEVLPPQDWQDYTPAIHSPLLDKGASIPAFYGLPGPGYILQGLGYDIGIIERIVPLIDWPFETYLPLIR